MIDRSGHFDEQKMGLEWVNPHCDGKLIFPKPPFFM
jgi:hypothetical protein